MYRYTGTHSRGRTLSVSLSLTRTHMHARAHTHIHTRARTRTHTHTLCTHFPSDVSFSLLPPTRHLVFLPSLSLCLSLLPICPWQRNKEPSKLGVEVKLLTVAIDIRREREQITATLCTPVYQCKIPVLGRNTSKNTGTDNRTGTQSYWTQFVVQSVHLWLSAVHTLFRYKDFR